MFSIPSFLLTVIRRAFHQPTIGLQSSLCCVTKSVPSGLFPKCVKSQLYGLHSSLKVEYYDNVVSTRWCLHSVLCLLPNVFVYFCDIIALFFLWLCMSLCRSVVLCSVCTWSLLFMTLSHSSQNDAPSHASLTRAENRNYVHSQVTIFYVMCSTGEAVVMYRDSTDFLN